MKHPSPRHTPAGRVARLAFLTPRFSSVALAAALGTLAVPPGAWAQISPEAATATATAPAATTSPSTGPVLPQQFTLSNGMTLIVQPDRRAPTAVQMVWVRVGSMDEVDGTSGVAHVLEHMMFKGTPSIKPGEFSRRIAALGGQENAFTSRDNTGYYQQLPVGKLEEAMKLESDRFAHNQWPDDEFKREIEVVKEERRMRTEDQPRALLGEQHNAAIFVASPYRRPVVGWMSDLDAMTPDDVRQFHQRWYVPANAALVVAGDVDVAAVRAMAEKYYGSIPASAVPLRKPRVEPEQRGLRRVEFKAPAEQAYVSLAFRAPQFGVAGLLPMPACTPPSGGTCAPASGASTTDNDDALALVVLSAVLDGYPGSRLDRALTQGADRVADSAGAYYGLSGRGPQLFGLEGVPAAGKTTDQLEAALRGHLTRVAKEGINAAELARVKTQWTASETYKLDSVMAQARDLGSNWVQELPLDASARLIARLQAVTAAQVQTVAAKYFGDYQLTVATLRPLPPEKNRRPRAAAPAGDLR